MLVYEVVSTEVRVHMWCTQDSYPVIIGVVSEASLSDFPLDSSPLPSEGLSLGVVRQVRN